MRTCDQEKEVVIRRIGLKEKVKGWECKTQGGGEYGVAGLKNWSEAT